MLALLMLCCYCACTQDVYLGYHGKVAKIPDTDTYNAWSVADINFAVS